VKKQYKLDSLHILIAEDEAVTAIELKSMVERLGHTVCAAAKNGIEAVVMAEQFDPDLIIMDIKMPKLDGIEAARQILRKRSLPLIILTAYPEEPYIENAGELGIYSFLVKPVRDANLRPQINLTMKDFFERELLKEKIFKLEEWRKNRKVVDQAKAVLMKRFGISEEDAYFRIHKYSRDNCCRISETAVRIAAGEALFSSMEKAG
jgi:response regulator NasT